jgi:hypothetical protein
MLLTEPERLATKGVGDVGTGPNSRTEQNSTVHIVLSTLSVYPYAIAVYTKE